MPSDAPPPRVLTQRERNRALLARQFLLERTTLPIAEVADRIGGLQTQYAPSGYVGLWTRVEGFRREELTDALEDRSIVQATLMRTTIHMVSRRNFWKFAVGVRRSRREWAARIRALPDEDVIQAGAAKLHAALAEGPRTVKELGEVASGFVGSLSLWVDLVRVPPSGTWERRRADRLGLADAWVGPEDATEPGALDFLVSTYLGAFGPAAVKEIADWAGLGVATVKEAATRLDLVEYADERGKPLIDLRGAPLPDGTTPAPVRFLPHWDANLLVHARRTGILPEVHRGRVFSTKNPFSVGTVLVDGRVVAGWSLVKDRIVVEPFEDIAAGDRREVERERQALEAFHA
ncbi:MAG TPA: winged helix DNA-binding domain-containing protein [Candidatus Limnocylindrales bacterium]|nr:winged helix DNA-binding domain-containing protein [Candidatus Limnocylindrales bacterium]